MIISVIACPGEGRGHDLAVRRPRCRHRGGDRAMHEAPPPSGVPALLANHRPPHPAETRSPPRARQLCHPQACHPQACQGDGMARQAPALSPALHPDLGIVAQPSRALLRLDHSSPHPARCLHLGARTRSGHPRLPRPSQCPPQALRLDKIGRGNPCQSQPRASHPGNRRERESSDKLSTLACFGVFLWAALLWISRGVPILGESADQLVWFALKWRLLIIVLMIVVSPQRADLRLLAFDDTDARICFWWLAVYFAVISLSSILIWLVERLGFGHDTVIGAALAGGVPITPYKGTMYWANRRPIARAILAATGSEPGPVRRAVAISWHWFFIILTLGIFLTASIEFSLGKGASSVFSAASATTGIIVALAVL